MLTPGQVFASHATSLLGGRHEDLVQVGRTGVVGYGNEAHPVQPVESRLPGQVGEGPDRAVGQRHL